MFFMPRAYPSGLPAPLCCLDVSLGRRGIPVYPNVGRRIARRTMNSPNVECSLFKESSGLSPLLFVWSIYETSYYSVDDNVCTYVSM